MCCYQAAAAASSADVSNAQLVAPGVSEDTDPVQLNGVVMNGPDVDKPFRYVVTRCSFILTFEQVMWLALTILN